MADIIQNIGAEAIMAAETVAEATEVMEGTAVKAAGQADRII